MARVVYSFPITADLQKRSGLSEVQLRDAQQLMKLPKKDRNARLRKDLGLTDRQVSLLVSTWLPNGQKTIIRGSSSVLKRMPPTKAGDPLEQLFAARSTPAMERLRKIRSGELAHPDPWCEHLVRRRLCVICTPDIAGKVLYITDGGSHVHTRPDCRLLAAGQEKVERRGGSPSPIEPVGAFSIDLHDREWCRGCRPANTTNIDNLSDNGRPARPVVPSDWLPSKAEMEALERVEARRNKQTAGGEAHHATASLETGASFSNGWRARCTCGWTKGPGSKKKMAAAASSHQGSTRARPEPESPQPATSSERKWDHLAETDIGCFECDTPLWATTPVDRIALGAWCPSCDHHWLWEDFDRQTRRWLLDAGQPHLLRRRK